MQTYRLFNDIDINILSSIPKTVNITNIVQLINLEIPKHLFSEIDVVYIGNFDFLTKEFEIYKFMENAIYLSDTISSNEDILLYLIQALSESIQEKNSYLIYENMEIINEINVEESFADILVDYLLYDKLEVKAQKPKCYRLIQEIIDNETC
tara:strand:+ start:80 stop:535 length:456 start_codon:yes stop_codon:yes gene_type:complete